MTIANGALGAVTGRWPHARLSVTRLVRYHCTRPGLVSAKLKVSVADDAVRVSLTNAIGAPSDTVSDPRSGARGGGSDGDDDDGRALKSTADHGGGCTLGSSGEFCTLSHATTVTGAHGDGNDVASTLGAAQSLVQSR